MNPATRRITWTRPYFGVTHGSYAGGTAHPWATVTARGDWAEMTKHHPLTPLTRRETTQHESVEAAKAAGEAWLRSL